MRIVVDANVILSSFDRPHGIPARVIRFALENDLLLSTELCGEVERGLTKRYFAEVSAKPDTWEAWAALQEAAEFLSLGDLPEVETDPNDLHVLALARDGRSDAIVTGDKRLLALDPWDGIRVLRPSEFLSTFGVD